jgi:hypothetical protein
MKLHIKILSVFVFGILTIAAGTLAVGAFVIDKTSYNLNLQFLDASTQKVFQKIEAAQAAMVDAGTVGIEQFEKNARTEVLKALSQEMRGVMAEFKS